MDQLAAIRTFLRGKLIKQIICITLMISCVFLTACKSSQADMKKVKDLDFTVVEDADVPEELMTIINEKKAQPFKLTYSNKEYKYIVVGYGEQKTGGYSITVDDLYLTNEGIYINTNLIGPSKQEVVTQAFTYPYVVIKIEYMDKDVKFE